MNDSMTQDLDFEEKIKSFPYEVQFLARQTRELRDDQVAMRSDIADIKVECQKRSLTGTCTVGDIGDVRATFTRKQVAVVAGGGGTLVVLLTVLLEALLKHFNILLT